MRVISLFRYRGKFPLLFLFILIFIAGARASEGSANISFSAVNCRALFDRFPAIARSSYQNILDGGFVKNQCGPTCAVETAVGSIEQIVSQKMGKSREFSGRELAARMYLEQAENLLVDDSKPATFGGASTTNVFAAIDRYGLLPEKASDNPSKESVDSLLRTYLGVVNNFRRETTFSPGLRKGYLALAKQHLQAAFGDFVGGSELGAPRLKGADIALDGFGITQYFTQKGLDVLSEGLPEAKLIEVISDVGQKQMGSAGWYKSEKINSLASLITDAFQKKRPVQIGVFWDPRYVDEKRGLMLVPRKAAVPTVDELKNLQRHNMRIVGYKLNDAGEITWLRLRNSYGENHGDFGELNVHSSYLENFLQSIEVIRTE